jgi:hypothetical protein
MCNQLSEIRDALGAFAKRFDPTLVGSADLALVVSLATSIESTASAILALAAARVAETKSWKDSGHRDAADALSKQAGMTPSHAREILQTGKALSGQPELAGAALSGELSPTQTSLIAQATTADPSSAPRLIHQARQGSVGELKDAVAATKAAAASNPEARFREIHRRRRLKTWIDAEGAWHLHAIGTTVDGAQITAALDPISAEIFTANRKAGTREHPGAYAFDALLTMAIESSTSPTDDDVRPTDDARSPDSPDSDPGGRPTKPLRRKPPRPRQRGAPTKIIFRVDFDAWLRGIALPGEICEISGYGPVPIAAVDHALGHNDPFISAVITKTRTLHGVAHLGRAPNVHQQTALEWIYPTCGAAGCTAKARLERDHAINWSETHQTVLDHLDLLCHHHHALKTRKNWALVEGRGKRPFVPPDDPRHPRHTRRSRCESSA